MYWDDETDRIGSLEPLGPGVRRVRNLAFGLAGIVVTVSSTRQVAPGEGLGEHAPRAIVSATTAAVVVPRLLDRTARRHQQIALALGSLGADALLTAPVVAAVERQAKRLAIDPLLVVAVIAHENPDLDPTAVSPAGATGIMQVMPHWRASFSASCGDDLLTVETNICFGIRVLQSHLEDAHGSLERALLSYVGCIKDVACRSYPERVLSRWHSLRADDSTSIVPAALWGSLSPPDALTLDWLARRIPGLDGTSVHTLTADAFDAMLADAAKRGMSPVDFFTDAGFRGRETYYVPQAATISVLSRYEVRVLTAASGSDTDGQPFQMVGLVLGGGRVDALYDRDNFTFTHPEFDNGRYTLAARVSQVILGPGDMSISGITAHVAFFSPTIQRITKISPTIARIKTSLGSRNKPSTPIRRRQP